MDSLRTLPTIAITISLMLTLKLVLWFLVPRKKNM